MNQIKNICNPYRENVKYKLNDNTKNRHQIKASNTMNPILNITATKTRQNRIFFSLLQTNQFTDLNLNTHKYHKLKKYTHANKIKPQLIKLIQLQNKIQLPRQLKNKDKKHTNKEEKQQKLNSGNYFDNMRQTHIKTKTSTYARKQRQMQKASKRPPQSVKSTSRLLTTTMKLTRIQN